MNRAKYAALASVSILFISLFLKGPACVNADSAYLPEDATPLQRAINEALAAAKQANEPAPNAEYLSYGNGTTLTILTYDNGTQRQFRETFRIENVGLKINPDNPLLLPINTTDEEATAYLTKIQDILLGFTFQIPKYEWTIGIPGIAEGGITIDIGFGLRLPIRISLEYPEIMVTDRCYTLYASLNGLDWTAADYANSGLQPDENEFLCKFIFKAWMSFMGSELFSFGLSFDESKSFSTPVGLGETFPLPRIPIPLNPLIRFITGVDLDPFVLLALEIGPNLGSNKVTADWKAENGAVGEGKLLWTHDDEELDFDIETQNIITKARITLSEFRYWFTVFTVDFFLSADFEGILDFLGKHEILVYTLDLSDIIGSLDLSVGVHQYTIGTVHVSVFVIPEVFVGALATILAMFGALGFHSQMKNVRSKRFYRNPSEKPT